MQKREENVVLRGAYSHQVARVDTDPLSQKGLSSGSARSRVKSPPLAHQEWSAKLASSKPSSTQRDHADADPRHIQPRGRIGAQIERVNDEQRSRHDVHALIQHRITLYLFHRDKPIRHEIQNRANPAENVNDKFDVHSAIIKEIVLILIALDYNLSLQYTLPEQMGKIPVDNR